MWTMVDQARALDTAVSLMRMALALLDQVNEMDAAVHLQWSIDIATKQPIMQPGDELDPELVRSFFPDLH